MLASLAPCQRQEQTQRGSRQEHCWDVPAAEAYTPIRELGPYQSGEISETTARPRIRASRSPDRVQTSSHDFGPVTAITCSTSLAPRLSVRLAQRPSPVPRGYGGILDEGWRRCPVRGVGSRPEPSPPRGQQHRRAADAGTDRAPGWRVCRCCAAIPQDQDCLDFLASTHLSYPQRWASGVLRQCSA